MRKHYLSILGLQEDASEEEIKRAFRKKALQYHPDKNKQANSEEKFITICKAYEALQSGEILHPPSSVSQTAGYYWKRYNRDLSPEEMEIRLQKAKEHAMYKKYTEDNILHLAYKDVQQSFIRKFSNIVAVVSISIATLILFDFSLMKPDVERAVVLHQYQNGLTQKTVLYDVNTIDSLIAKKFTFYTSIEDNTFKRIPINSMVKVYRTPLLHQRVAYSDLHTAYENSMFSSRNLYQGYWFFQIVFFIPLLNFFAKGPNSVYLVFIHLNSSLPIFAFLLFIGGLLFL